MLHSLKSKGDAIVFIKMFLLGVKSYHSSIIEIMSDGSEIGISPIYIFNDC